MEVFNSVVACLALVVAAYTFLKHDRQLKQQERLINQYQLEKIEAERSESRKAVIEAFVIKGVKGSRTIKVFNKGKAVARNVSVFIPKHRGYDIMENPSPIDIRPQNGIEVSLVLFGEGPSTTQITFEWKDDFREANVEDQTIQLR